MFKHRIRVCHVSTVHSPFDTRIFHKECKTLVKAGYEVILIAKHDRDDVVDGIKIIALPKPKNRFHRMLTLAFKAFWLAFKQKANIYHFHDPELIPIGVLLKLQGRRVIYDVHEDVPRDILGKEWIHPWLRAMVGKGAEFAEWVGGRCFDGVIATTPTIRERFRPSKTVIVQNFPILNGLSMNTSVPYRVKPQIICYVGAISNKKGATEMIQAMTLLPENMGARLRLAGNFSPASLEDEVKELPGWERTDFLGWLSREEIAELLGKCRIGLAVLHPTACYPDSYPIKLFEYMLAAIPVIASNFTLWREIIEGTGCGLTVDPLDYRGIADAIMWLFENPIEAEEMGKRGQKAVYERFNWGREAEKLLLCYQGILQ